MLIASGISFNSFGMKTPVNVEISDTLKVYNGLAQSVSFSINVGGLNTSITYDGSLTQPVNAGTYEVIVTVIDDTFEGADTATMVISKANAIINVLDSVEVYDGTTQSLTLSTFPSSLSTIVTYNGLPQLPVNAGDYVYSITISDVNYQGTRTGVFRIEKAQAILSITDTVQTYSGTNRSLNVNTLPIGLSTVVTYGGSSSLPVNAGTYVARVDVNDPNFEGGQTVSFIVEKAVAPIVVTDTLHVYDGNPKTPSVSTTPSGLAYTVTYNNSLTPPTQAGTYNLDIVINNQNYQGTRHMGFVIEKAPVELTISDTSYIYDGNAKSITLATSLANVNTQVTYDGSSSIPVDAGIYAVVASVVEDNYKGTKNSTLIIRKASALVNLQDQSFVYNGQQQSANVTTQPAGLPLNVLYNGNVDLPVNVGSYIITAIINDENYTGNAQATLTVTKGRAHIIAMDLVQEYDQGEKTLTVQTVPTALAVDLRYNGVATRPINSGTYEVNARVIDPNWEADTIFNFRISKAQTSIHINNLNQVYDGQPKNVSLSIRPEGLPVQILYNNSNSVPLDAGTYKVVAVVDEFNYTGIDSAEFVISKAEQTIEFRNIDDFDKASSGVRLVGEASSGLDVTYVVVSGNAAEVQGDSLKPKSEGLIRVAAIQAGNNNYLAADSIIQEVEVLPEAFPVVGNVLNLAGDSVESGSVTIYKNLDGFWTDKGDVNVNNGVYSSRLPKGDYIFRYNPPTDTSIYLETYSGSVINWQDAYVNTIKDSSSTIQTFTADYRPEKATGETSIGGTLLRAISISVDGANPVTEILPLTNLFLLNINKRFAEHYAESDSFGIFSFQNVEPDDYLLLVDYPQDIRDTFLPLVRISSNVDSMNVTVTKLFNGVNLVTNFVNPKTGVEDLVSSINAGPNPFDEKIELEVDEWDGELELVLLNSIGQIVQKGKVSCCRKSVTIDTQSVSKGVFYLCMYMGDKSKVYKMVKR